MVSRRARRFAIGRLLDSHGSPAEVRHEDPEPIVAQNEVFGLDDLGPVAPKIADAGAGADAGGSPNMSPLARVPLPLPGVTPSELAAFESSIVTFQEIETVDDGLGPIFNGNSCGGCHSQPGPGGGSHFFETRFGRQAVLTDAGSGCLDASGADAGAFASFDPLMQLGGDLQQFFSIGSQGAPAGCAFPIEIIPPQADIIALRRTTPLFGLGLVDNVPPEELELIAALQAAVTPSTAGRVGHALDAVTHELAISKFGWKAQVVNLFQFAGNAYNNEMGVTNPLFPQENCPNDLPNCALVQRCNPQPGLNDDGTDVQAFFEFMTFLAPMERGPNTPSVQRGQKVFSETGCANCHIPTLVTGPNASAALDRKVFHPYSDFLLHDFGTSADGIGPDEGNAAQQVGIARANEMRTSPLWGIRTVDRFLHDGRARTIPEAIRLHDGQAARARDRFERLNLRQQIDLVNFVLAL
jgi:hypothetical protein